MGFLYSLYERNTTSKIYEQFTNTNIELSRLSAEFIKSWNSFNNFIKTRNSEELRSYNEANNNIMKLMDEVSPAVERDANSGIYLRNLRNMFQAYESNSYGLINKVINVQQLDTKSYEKLVELKALDTHINSHSELLEVSFLNYSNREYSATVEMYKNTQLKIYSILIIIVLFSFVFTMMASRNLGRTIGKLRKYAELLSDAKWEIPDIQEQKYSELNSLAKAFNKMKNSIREFINELHEKAELENNYNIEMRKSAEKDKLIKETQLLALQSQMDPHFLFNTLNTISRMAMFEAADNTVNLIGAASKILRYNLDYKDKMVKLKDEMSMIKAYVTIQETRFQDQMNFTFDVDKSLDYIDVPPMLIQPIVENAIIHGLREKDSGGIINITVKREDDLISISISDNGMGIDEEKMKNLLNENKEGRRGLGVLNVKKRLELYYKRSDLFKIESVHGKGTVVTISIPAEGGKDNVDTLDC